MDVYIVFMREGLFGDSIFKFNVVEKILINWGF